METTFEKEYAIHAALAYVLLFLGVHNTLELVFNRKCVGLKVS